MNSSNQRPPMKVHVSDRPNPRLLQSQRSSMSMDDSDRRNMVSQRRLDDAVGNIGIIETGLPSTMGRKTISSRRPKSSAGGSIGSSSHSTTHMARTMRTNRSRFSQIIMPGQQQQISEDDNLMVEGRAKVLTCEVVSGNGSVSNRCADNIRRLWHSAGAGKGEQGEGNVGAGREVLPRTTARSSSATLGSAAASATATSTRNINPRNNRRTILHPMRMDMPAGCVTAILGSAESGKTTLLKFLAGRMDRNVVYEGAVNLSGSSAYLPEQVHLHGFYTPRTYIQHYDRLISAHHRGGGCASLSKSAEDDEDENNNRNGNRRSLAASSAKRFMGSNDIEQLLNSLRIDQDRRDTVVGDILKRGLNRGEQRRLELGLCVLGSPDTLFCENPVEGLDSETSLHIMEFLKGYISNNINRRVIVTLNRPSPFVWNLIDNVILLSKGRIVYEGPRFDMESFFAYHKMPTPQRFSPLEHYLAVINNFRRPDAAVNWETAFKQWQDEADEDDGDDLADDIETCFPSAIPDVIIPQINTNNMRDTTGMSQLLGLLCCCFCSGWSYKFLELLHRYTLNMIRNPGMLLIRLVMYTGLSLLLGLLFYNLEHDNDYQAINSRAALLFYSSSFYIFMAVSVLPFLAQDQDIRDKEVLNGFYHPLTHHLAVTVASIPAVLILALVITIILVGMVKLQNATCFFLILMLALWCAESYAFLMALCVKNYIIGIVCLAGIFGASMPLEGFMLIPSKFPSWLSWTYFAPFHTYTWRSLMYNEFSNSPSGMDVLKSYEIENTNIRDDILVLFFYSMLIQLVCAAKLLLGNTTIMAQKTKEA